MRVQQELEKLILKCKKGDSEAFNDLIQRYSNRCYAYFYRLTGRADLSDELLSDLFIRLVRKIGSFKSGSFEKWIFTVASNIFRDYLRRHYRQKRLLAEKADLLLNDQNVPKQTPRVATAPKDMFSANGALNRRCFIVPSLQLVVTRLGDQPTAKNNGFDRQLWKLIMEASPTGK